MTRARRFLAAGALGAAAAVVVALASAGCRRGGESGSGTPGAGANWANGANGGKAGGPPRGDAVWFTDAAAVSDPGVAERLTRLSVGAVFLPAARVTFTGGHWSAEAAAPPPAPPTRSATVLAVSAGAELSEALAGQDAEISGVAPALAEALAGALAPSGPWGRVIGVHLDFPFTPASAKHGGDLLDALRRKLPAGTMISIAAAFAPATEEARKRLAPLVDRADALVAPVFGLPSRADLAAVDMLRRPWWAEFATGSRGSLTRASDGATASVPESALDALSGNPKMEFENDLSVPDASYASFHLIARGPVRAGGLALESGDRVTFRVPALTEMLYQLGSALAGKRYALGRLLVFDGPADPGRVFPVAAFEDIAFGRKLAPALSVRVSPAGRGAVTLESGNATSQASIPSRTSNWIEIDVAPAHPGDVALGGFDRYATYDRNGQAVTPGRATRVRFYETIILPGESISPARIVVRGGVPARCCPTRSHMIAAAGSESETDWTEPPAPVPPTPARAGAARDAKKRR